MKKPTPLTKFDFEYIRLDVKLAQLNRGTKQLSSAIDLRNIAKYPVDVNNLLDEDVESNIEMQIHFEPTVRDLIALGEPF